jgi:hypothetical protein
MLGLPLACAPGRDCWIANYVDADPGAGVRDYACGRMSYNGHDGTDFALRDLRAMAEGVPVLAAAAGVVRGARDGEPDRSIREAGPAAKGRECGNGVRLEHPGGWSTQYCHLRRGSVAVKPGEPVSAGARLGLVGLSGQTEFPHVHLSVRLAGRTVDPFTGPGPAAGCGPGPAPLWNPEALAALRYARGAIYNHGVAGEVPAAERARRGEYRAHSVAAAAPRLALWAEVLGSAPGDAIELELAAPDGSRVIAQRIEIRRAQARIFRWIARNRGGVDWPAGKYHARIAYFSPDVPARVLSAVEFAVEVE